jgi:hypothetical protein
MEGLMGEISGNAMFSLVKLYPKAILSLESVQQSILTDFLPV